MYVDETYNLAVRTKFKYERTTEAVAVLSLGLFALGLAALFVIFAAVSPPQRAVDLDCPRRILLGLYFTVFTFTQLVHVPGTTRRQSIERCRFRCESSSSLDHFVLESSSRHKAEPALG
jgi:hypothetical protein